MNKLIDQLTIIVFVLAFQCCIQPFKEAKVSFSGVNNVPLNKIPANAIVLHDNWQMKESAIIGIEGKTISLPGYKTNNWYPTTVPTTVLGVLIRNGIYPDPYIGLNNMQIPDANDTFNKRYNLGKFSHLPDSINPWTKPYWFRREFEIPGDYAGKKIWLNLDGINYRADIWINGHLIANSKDVVGMFRRFRFDITDYAVPGGQNAMAICIHQLDYPGDPVYAQLEGLNGSFGKNSGDGEILRNVTQYSTIGWDWVPAARDRNIGIWQHVSINSSGPVVVADPAAFTDVIFNKDTTANTTVRFFVSNATENSEEVKLNIKIKSKNQAGLIADIDTTIKIDGKSREEIILKPEDFPKLTMVDPDLWWPVGYGSQPLYTLEVKAEINGQISSVASSRFGVREVESYTLPSGGRAFSVNGRPIRITGGAWISDFLLSWSAQRYRDEVRLMAGGNATVVRVNGCSIMPPDVFFDACDEFGLLVWEDFSRTSATGENYPTRWDWHPKECDSTIYMDNMVDFISRVRGHSSILLWCGCNEAAPQENTGKALQNEILPKMDGTRIFLPSSHEQPEWSSIDINTFTGGPWHIVKLPTYYELFDQKKSFESKNEIGLPSPPTINTIAKYIPDFNIPEKETFPFNKTMGYHDATGIKQNGRFRDYAELIQESMGECSSVAEFLKWSDLFSNQTYRTIFEAANKSRPRNNLVVLWKSNAAWPSFMWQIYDWTLRPNAGYYSMKSACKPIHVQFSHDDGGIQVVSTLDKDLTGATIDIKVLSGNGIIKAEKQLKTDVPVNQTVHLESINEMIYDTNLYFVAMNLFDQSGKLLDRTVAWSQKNTKWHDLLLIPSVDLSCKVIGQNEVNGEVEYSIEVKNESVVPVVNVMLEVTNGTFGKEVLPSFWDDNELTIMPGETRNIKVKFRRDLLTKTAYVVAEGLNINPASWNLETGEKESLSFEIIDLNISTENEKVYLNFATSLSKGKGSRITTFPVKFSVDGKFIRFVSIAATKDMEINGRIDLSELKPGSHKIQLGNLEKEVFLKD